MENIVGKLNEIAKPRSEEAKERLRFRRENREWIRMSQEIALCIHYYLRKNNMTQKDLADKMNVTSVYVGKILKGGENLTLETICKLQKATGMELISFMHPYLCHQTLIITSCKRMTEHAVKSDSYKEMNFLHDTFVSTEYINNIA